MDKYRLVPNANMDFHYDSPYYDDITNDAGASGLRTAEEGGLAFHEQSGLFPPDVNLLQVGPDVLSYGPAVPAEAPNGKKKAARKSPKGKAAYGVQKKGKKNGKAAAGSAEHPGAAAAMSAEGRAAEDYEVKRMKRLLRNRVSAQLARERKKQYVLGLEKKAKESDQTIEELEGKIRDLTEENAELKRLVYTLRSQGPGDGM